MKTDRFGMRNSVMSKLRTEIIELLSYRVLLGLFIYRYVVSTYKQTVFGPVWFVIQPILTSLVQYIIFGRIANISSDEVPYFLFVLAGNTVWSYFSTTLLDVSDTFRKNQDIFGKVYFPRIIVPLSIAISGIIRFFIQFLFFAFVLFKYCYQADVVIINEVALFFPLLVIIMALMALGNGLIITSITTKYKDFSHLLKFGVTLTMYLTPIVYPTSLILAKLPIGLKWLAYLNPLTGLLDVFKYGFLGQGEIEWLAVLWTVIYTCLILIFGIRVFSRTSKKFIDII
jgi:lipopolysaccharide transport system permease protein